MWAFSVNNKSLTHNMHYVCLYVKPLDSGLWSIAIRLTAIGVYVLGFDYHEYVGVCVHVFVWGLYSVALLTGACLGLAVTLLLAQTEMDSHAAVEGQGYSWLSPSPVHQQHKHTDTEGQAHSLLKKKKKTVL